MTYDDALARADRIIVLLGGETVWSPHVVVDASYRDDDTGALVDDYVGSVTRLVGRKTLEVRAIPDPSTRHLQAGGVDQPGVLIRAWVYDHSVITRSGDPLCVGMGHTPLEAWDAYVTKVRQVYAETHQEMLALGLLSD